MQELFIISMNRFGYIGIALMIAVQNILPFIPSEIILTFGGFMTAQSHMNIWMAALFATIGSVSGAVTLYYIGRLMTLKPGWLMNKWVNILQVKRQNVIKAEDWFNKKGSITVFFCRLIPILRSIISIPAGIVHMHMGKFLLYTTIGTAIWNIALLNLGALAGENWKSIVNYINTYSYSACLVLSIIAGFIIWFIKKKRGRTPEEINSGNGDCL